LLLACHGSSVPPGGADLLRGRRPGGFAGSRLGRSSLGKAVLRVVGLFLVGMAVLQAWPGGVLARPGPTQRRPGLAHRHGPTDGPDPSAIVPIVVVAAFGRFDAAHGWSVNLFCVIALAVLGAGFLTARPQVARVTAVASAVFCLAVWVLVQDLGFLGG